MSIKKAAIPAVDNLIPKRFTMANVTIISEAAAAITAKLGARTLKVMSTTMPINMKAIIMAINVSRKKEDPKLVERYGRNSQNLLLARRLIEVGVRVITMNASWGGWDTHSNNFKSLGTRNLPQMDQGLSALIEDLDSRGMLDDVSIVVWGEFGRTPRVNAKAGRDHWGSVMSVLLAGGGLKPGIVGASNSKGEVPAASPYRPENVLATLYRHLGIDPELTFNDFNGRPRYILEERRVIGEVV